MKPPPLIEAHDLKVHFPVISGLMRRVVGHIKAIDGVDLTLAPGEVLGIVGETGSGKSTLGRALLRLIEPTEGIIKFEGTDITTQSKKELQQFRQKAQIVFQNPLASLNPRKTILESIGEALLYYKLVKSPREQQERVAEILSLVGIPTSAMHHYPHEFSGGQQQRICIGRAIILNPSLLICDEATSALDVSIQAQILNLLQELKTRLRLSYIFISHDLSIIRYLSDRVMVLYLGKVVETAPTRELFNHPKHPYTQALLSAIPKTHPNEIKQKIILQGEIPSARNPPSGCVFRTRCPYVQPICSSTPPTKTVNNSQLLSVHQYSCIL